MIRTAMIATTLMAGLAVPAFANTKATTDGLFVNIRSGAGVNHPATCLAWPNVTFNVTKCEGNWCHVEYLRSTGWMSAKHIDFQD